MFDANLEQLERHLLEGFGELDPDVRRAAARGDGVPEELAAYVDTVRRHAYRVTDREVADLLSAGWSQDQLFELTVAAAYGAARRRLHAGLDALNRADAPGASP